MPLHRLTPLVLLLLPMSCAKTPTPSSTPQSEETEGMPRRSIETAAQVAPEAFAPPAQTWPKLDVAAASRLVSLSIECADKEYPNKPSHVIEKDADLRPPRESTPAFFGCFDWHSAVHGHWTMATLLRLFPEMPQAKDAKALLDAHLTPERIAAEVAFVNLPRNATWERPYGYAWLLRLQAELLVPCTSKEGCDRDRWAAALQPLATTVRDRLVAYLNRLSVPIRDGTHNNTAFAMAHAWHYALAHNDSELKRVIHQRAMDFYALDVSCPAHFEPSGEDFLSGCLGEAHLMSMLMQPAEFATWFAAFLPPVDQPGFAPLRTPPDVLDPKDPRIGHLIGLSFHRAAAYQALAKALAPTPEQSPFLALAATHLRDGERQVAGSGYGGAHWLASFNLLAYVTELETATSSAATPQPAP